jgi:hypothetical protein
VGTWLKPHEVEGMRRSAAMAPLSTNSVERLLRSHAELSADWAEVEGLLRRLGPAWAELRSILNELNAVVRR